MSTNLRYLRSYESLILDRGLSNRRDFTINQASAVFQPQHGRAFARDCCSVPISWHFFSSDVEAADQSTSHIVDPALQYSSHGRGVILPSEK